MSGFDIILKEINEFGPYQKLRYFLICLAATIPGFVTYIHSFMAAKPDYICNQTEFPGNVSYSNITYNKCSYSVNNVEHDCNSWSFDKTYYESTLTEDWSLVCDRDYFRSNVQMVYFSGYIVGSLGFGYLSDVFGRRPIMLSSFLVIIAGAIGVAFGPHESFGFEISFGIYAISRFLIACGTRGINVTGYILALEIVGSKQRAFAACIFTAFFALGQMFLVGVAYFVRDWRTLGQVMVIPLIPFLGYVFVIAESPRWLITKNNPEKAYKVLDKIAKANKTVLSKEKWQAYVEEQSSVKEVKENFVDLLKSPKLVILTLTMYINWIANNLVFYGVGLKSNDLGVNPYLSFLISAIVELISILLTSPIISRFGRKKPYIACLLVASSSCLSFYFIDNVIVGVVLAMIGKFAISSSYCIIHLYSSEIFPTTMRGSCQGSCSMMARLGSILAPKIIALDVVYKGLPFLVFGMAALFSALTSIILPETLNKKLPENLQEAQKIDINPCRKTTSNQSGDEDDETNKPLKTFNE